MVKEEPQCTERMLGRGRGRGIGSADNDCARCTGARCGCTHLQPKMEDEDKSLPPWGMQDDTNKGHTQ